MLIEMTKNFTFKAIFKGYYNRKNDTMLEVS